MPDLDAQQVFRVVSLLAALAIAIIAYRNMRR
jgi:hypothetical protein